MVNINSITNRSSIKSSRVLFVVPGDPKGVSMIFAKRQNVVLKESGLLCKEFYLTSRTSPLVLIKEWMRFRREIRLFKPDLVHAHFGTVTSFFCVSSTSIPVVVTFRGSDINLPPGLSPVNWRQLIGILLSQVSALRARQIICVSNKLKSKLWWCRSHATVIPAGVDTKLFYPCCRDDARSEIGWSNDELVVLFNAGSDPKLKRLDLAQSAVDFAKTICGEIKFVVLSKVEPKLVPMMMNAADCLLLTSFSEGSPNVVKESLACNLPVVSVDVGDVSERLAGVWPSRIVGSNPEEIGSALAEILMQGDRSNGHEMIQELTLDKIIARTLSVYKAAIRQ